METGREYTMSVTYYSVDQSDDPMLDFKAPPGYKIEFNGETGTRFMPIYAGNFKFRVVPDDDLEVGRGGAASSLLTGRINWSVALGALVGGESAGFLRLLDSGISNDWSPVFTPAALTCDTRGVLGDVVVYRSPSGVPSPYIPGAIRQVCSPEVGIDVIPETTTRYRISVYGRSNVTDNGSGANPRYSFSNHPFVEYKVERIAATKLNITSTTKDPVTSTIIRTASTSLERTGSWPSYIWTLEDWHTGTSVLVQDRGTLSSVYYNNQNDYAVDLAWELRDPSQNPVAVATSGSRRFQMFAWGEEMTVEQRGGLTTTFGYYTSTSDPDSYTMLKSVSYPTGNWEAYEYYGPGEGGMTNGGFRVHRPFKDTPASVPASLSTNTQGDITKYFMATPAPGQPQRLARVERRLSNTLVSTAEFQYYEPLNYTANSVRIVRSDRDDWTDSAGNKLKTVTRSYRNVVGGLPYPNHAPLSVENPDKTKTVFVYHLGTLTGTSFTKGAGAFGSGSAGRICKLFGTTQAAGNTYSSSYDGQSFLTSNDSATDVFYLVAGRSSMEVTIRNSGGQIVRAENHVWTGSAWVLARWENIAYNDFGFLTSRTGSNSAVHTVDYLGELKRSETSEDGTTTRYYSADPAILDHYDEAGRPIKETSDGVTGGPSEITTEFVFNAAGQIRFRKRGPTPKITEEWNYDLAGRVSSSSVPGQVGAVTTTYSYPNGGRDMTVTDALQKTETLAYHRDGRPLSSTGTAAIPKYFAYKVASDGKLVTRVQGDAGSDPDTDYGAGWQKVVSDWVGRPYIEFAPTTTVGTFIGTKYAWSTTNGRLVSTVAVNQNETAVGAYTRYEYDVFGDPVRVGLDVNGDGLILASSDRIADYAYGFELRSGYWWSVIREKIYPTVNSGTPLQVSEVFERATFPNQTAPEVALAETESFDRHGNRTLQQTAVNRSAKTRYLRTTQKGSTTTAETEFRVGLPVRTVSLQGVTTLIAYDDWRRKLQIRESTVWPNPNSPGEAPRSTHPGALLTHYGYYDGTELVKETGNWAGFAFKTHRLGYDGLNRVSSDTQDNDHGAITSYFGYDDRGLLTHKWGSAQHPIRFDYDNYGRKYRMHTFRGGSGWEGSTLPTAFASPVETTTWTYDGPSGLMKEKSDAKSRRVTFTFDALNRVSSREWERTVASGQNAGQRVKTSYAYYDQSIYRTGELNTITYNDDTTSVTYSYERDGQLSAVTDQSGARSFSYNSKRLISGETLPNLFGARKIARVYNSGTGDSAGGIILATAFGPAANPWAGPGNGNLHQTNYGYDWSKGRLNDVNRLYDSAATQSFSYEYRSNSNRVTAVSSGSVYKVEHSLQSWRMVAGSVTTYGANGGSLSAKATYSSNFDWLGRRTDETLGNGSVSQLLGVNGSIAQYWRKQIDSETWFYGHNSRSEIVGERVFHAGVEVTSKSRGYAYDNGWNRTQTTVGGQTTNYTYAVSDSTATANEIDYTSSFEAEDLRWDADGNLISDGSWTYGYDAENRLRTVSRTGESISYTYDYMGRRVRKLGIVGSTPVDTRYVFDGWSLIAELNADANLVRSYTWGLDASGTMGAGGTGGLLMISVGTDGATRLFPVYDGRNNVTGLLDQNGVVVGAYSYDSFGRTTGNSGTQTGNNPFGFATQYTEADVGLVYFGYRYYSPRLGRFINRDPIGEEGGANLFAYTGNNPVDGYDVLGLSRFRFYGGLVFSRWDQGDSFGGGGLLVSWGSDGERHSNSAWRKRYQKQTATLDRRAGIRQIVWAADGDGNTAANNGVRARPTRPDANASDANVKSQKKVVTIDFAVDGSVTDREAARAQAGKLKQKLQAIADKAGIAIEIEVNFTDKVVSSVGVNGTIRYDDDVTKLRMRDNIDGVGGDGRYTVILTADQMARDDEVTRVGMDFTGHSGAYITVAAQDNTLAHELGHGMGYVPKNPDPNSRPHSAEPGLMDRYGSSDVPDAEYIALLKELAQQ